MQQSAINVGVPMLSNPVITTIHRFHHFNLVLNVILYFSYMPPHHSQNTVILGRDNAMIIGVTV